MKAFRVMPQGGDEPAAGRYVVALVLSICALGARQLLEPVLQGQAPFIVLLAAPILSAWYGGLLPGWASLLVCAVGGQLLFVDAGGFYGVKSPGDALKLLLVLGVGGLAAWLIATRRTALDDLRNEHVELQRVQDELAVRERRVRQTFEASPSGMLLIDGNGRINLVNHEAERMFGYARDELVGTSVDQLVPDYARDGHAENRAAYRNERRRRAMGRGNELKALRKDGTVFHVEIGLNPLQGESEGLVLASVLDMSEQRAAAEALRRSRTQLQRLFESDLLGVMLWTTDRQVLDANEELLRIWGRSRDELGTLSLADLTPPEYAGLDERALQELRATGRIQPVEKEYQRPDGSRVWVLVGSAMTGPDTGMSFVLDISSRKAVEIALRDADRRKDEFIAVLAHELRNPLAPVRNAVEILKRVGAQEPRVARTRDIIDRQVTHMARLIDDLLDVSRIARGKLTLRKELCDLNAIVCQTADDYRTSLEGAGQQLQLRACNGSAWVEGDPVRLAQMVGNLLTNAARFNNGPGTVLVDCYVEPGPSTSSGRTGDTPRPVQAEPVEARPARDRVRIVVTDTGIGMDQELIERLFDPFAQATQDIARSRGGLGLGLALTKGLAELHGGSVLAESEGPGKGSRFTITLPLATSSRPERASAKPDGDAEALRILVIEDNPDAASTLGELLQLKGHEVELAFDGRTGIEVARRMLPDVVISDIGLPGNLSGYDVGRALRDDPSLEGVHLIALSGYADAMARRRCTEAGYDAHLAKPPDIRALEKALAAVRARGDRAQADAEEEAS